MLIQDDDSAPKGDGWLSQALKLFNSYPAGASTKESPCRLVR